MDIAENLRQIRARIRDAEIRHGRAPGSVSLLAVSKTHSATTVYQAYQAGQKKFGENYVQEAAEKQQVLAGCDIEWHFVGSIQSNKTQYIAEHFDWIHSISRLKIAKRLNEQRPSELPPLNVCVEVNIDHQATKTGVQPEALLALISEITALHRLRLRGLMVIPKPLEDVKQQEALFKKVAALKDDLVAKGFQLDTLSMGTTQDFEAAIAAGSTIVRLGNALFGERAS